VRCFSPHSTPPGKQHLICGHERQRVDLESAVRSPIRHAHPFDGFDRLPFDKLRVCDTAGRLRMTLSRVEWVRAPSEVEGLALAATSEPGFLPVRGKTRFADGAPERGLKRRATLTMTNESVFAREQADGRIAEGAALACSLLEIPRYCAARIP
jgi:hypothetical protein